MGDAKIVAKYCSEKIDLKNAELSEEYFYQSLPLCVIDAIFSIGVNYSSTKNTVIRYCNYFNLKRIRVDKNKIPPIEEQQSISDFLIMVEKYGIKKFTEEIFDNRQRTSPTNGILKTKAVYLFANALKEFEVNYLQDIKKVINNYDFKKEIKKIPGQRSGISLSYFFMLAGFNNYIKPDRMVLRFLKNVLEKDINLKQAHNLLIETSDILKKEYNHINPRLLDHQIWKSENVKNWKRKAEKN